MTTFYLDVDNEARLAWAKEHTMGFVWSALHFFDDGRRAVEWWHQRYEPIGDEL